MESKFLDVLSTVSAKPGRSVSDFEKRGRQFCAHASAKVEESSSRISRRAAILTPVVAKAVTFHAGEGPVRTKSGKESQH